MYHVEKNVPIPPRTGASASKYPPLEVGDSISVPVNGESVKKVSARLASAYRNRQPGQKFSIRAVSDDTVRVWRTK